MFKKWMFKLIIKLLGIRFYKMDKCNPENCNATEFKKINFSTTEKNEIIFSFYKEEYIHYVYRNDKVIEDKRFRFIIKAKLDQDFPDKLHRYNDIVFYIKACYLTWFNEDIIVDCLLNIYLDFIHFELKK